MHTHRNYNEYKRITISLIAKMETEIKLGLHGSCVLTVWSMTSSQDASFSGLMHPSPTIATILTNACGIPWAPERARKSDGPRQPATILRREVPLPPRNWAEGAATVVVRLEVGLLGLANRGMNAPMVIATAISRDSWSFAGGSGLTLGYFRKHRDLIVKFRSFKIKNNQKSPLEYWIFYI